MRSQWKGFFPSKLPTPLGERVHSPILRSDIRVSLYDGRRVCSLLLRKAMIGLPYCLFIRSRRLGSIHR